LFQCSIAEDVEESESAANSPIPMPSTTVPFCRHRTWVSGIMSEHFSSVKSSGGLA